MAEIALSGCTAEPLMSYLKALGIFRLVAEQPDPTARLSWKQGVAQLDSCLDRDALTTFLLEKYSPTPIVGPWGARSGFYSGSSESAARGALEAIVAAAKTNPRLAAFREMIVSIQELLRRHGFLEKVKDEDKLTLMQACRNELPDRVLPWLDAVFVLTDESRKFPPLLGTGGNEGSGSYVSTFAQVVVSLIVERKDDRGLPGSLFGEFTASSGDVAVGHFNPGAVGGANSSQGFAGGGGVNAWDYLLAIEGCLLFAGKAARRYGVETAGRQTAYPFCVDAVPVGYASESEKESATSTRAELWLPLWSSPVSLGELLLVFGEGRAQFGRVQARNAVEFALALATLGVSSGFDSFTRYAIVMRNGLSFFAAPLGRITVQPRPKARLLEDPALALWVQRLRSACRDTERTPARYQAALRDIDRATYGFANRSEGGNDAKYLLEIVRALGRAERTLAAGLSFCKERFIRPLQELDPQWLEQASDGTVEFQLATSIAGIQAAGTVGPSRAFLEPVARAGFVSWEPGSASAVWSGRSLAANLAAVFRRRLMEAYRDADTWHQRGVPLYSPRSAPVEAIVTFLSEETDDAKLEDLIWALSAVKWNEVRWPSGVDDPVLLGDVAPFEFGVPRLLVERRTITRSENARRWQVRRGEEANASPDPDVFAALASGRSGAVGECVDRAARRLKSGGRLVHGYRNRDRTGRSLAVQSRIPAERLLAAMLFPVSDRELSTIANSVLSPPDDQERNYVH